MLYNNKDVLLKNNLIENKDYVLVSKELYNKMKELFSSYIDIKRNKIIIDEDKNNYIVEVNLIKFKVVIVSNISFFKESSNLYNLIKPFYVQLSNYDTFNTFFNKIKTILSYYKISEDTFSDIKIYKIGSDNNLNNIEHINYKYINKQELITLLLCYYNKANTYSLKGIKIDCSNKNKLIKVRFII